MDLLERLMGGEEEYRDFIHEVLQAQEMDNLPVCLKFFSPLEISMQDIQEFSNMVKEDTNLDAYFQAFTCNACGELHLQMVVFEDEDDGFYEEPNAPLQ